MKTVNQEMVAVTDQANNKIYVFKLNAKDWNDKDACTWSWFPTKKMGFDDCEKWANPSDVRLRHSELFGGPVALTCASGGFAAIIKYPTGQCVWSLKNSDLVNPHAVELLPNGYICIADSQGHSISVYNTLHNSENGPESRIYFEDAHGLLWDPKNRILWALGNEYITGFSVGDNPNQTELHEITQLRRTLPSIYGHDLQPVFGNDNLLWVTSGDGIYQFDKNLQLFKTDYADSDMINCENAKSIGNQPFSNTVIRAVPNGTMYPWNTNSIDLFVSNESSKIMHETRMHDSGAFYKARVWFEKYQ